jgi:hypothetical protein
MIIQDTNKGQYNETGLSQTYIDIPLAIVPTFVPGPYVILDPSHLLVWRELKCTNSTNPKISTGIRWNLEDITVVDPFNSTINMNGDRTFGKPWIRIDGPARVSKQPIFKWVNEDNSKGTGEFDKIPKGSDVYEILTQPFNLEFELTGKFYREVADYSISELFLKGDGLDGSYLDVNWVFKNWFNSNYPPIMINDVEIDRTFLPDTVVIKFSIEVVIDYSQTRDFVLNGMRLP